MAGADKGRMERTGKNKKEWNRALKRVKGKGQKNTRYYNKAVMRQQGGKESTITTKRSCLFRARSEKQCLRAFRLMLGRDGREKKGRKRGEGKGSRWLKGA